MATLYGNVYFNGGSINFLSSGDIRGSGLFFGSSRNENSIRSGFFYNQSINKGTVWQATFTENSVNSGYVLYDAVFTDTSNNKGTIYGNALFATTAINNGAVSGSTTISGQDDFNQLGYAIYTGTQLAYFETWGGSGIMVSGTGIFCDYSRNGTSIVNAIFFDNSFNQRDPLAPHGYHYGTVNKAIFCENSHNDYRVNCGYFYDNSRNNFCVKTGFFYENSVNGGEIECYAVFDNNSINLNHIYGNALFLGNSENDGFIVGCARFASTATNSTGGSAALILEYIPNAKEWTQVSSFLQTEPFGERHYNDSPNRVAINNDGSKIIVKTNSSTFNAYSLQNEPDGGYLGWDQIGTSILNSGIAVSMNANGNRVAIGHPYDCVGGIYNNSSVTVYDLIGSDWVQYKTKITFDHQIGVKFGKSVSLNAVGDRIAIGAPETEGYNGEMDNGVVYVQAWDEERNEWGSVGWSFIHGKTGEKIGRSVKLNASGDRVVFGYPFKVYHATGVIRNNDPSDIETHWFQLGSDINLPNPRSGWSYNVDSQNVSMNAAGDRILVSMQMLGQIVQSWDGQNYNTCCGVVAAYSWNGSSWNQMGSVLNSPSYEDGFGVDAKMNSLGDKIIIGQSTSRAGSQLTANGTASVYDWNSSNWIKNNYDVGNPSADMNAPYFSYCGHQVLIAASGNTIYSSEVISGTGFISQFRIL
jgi:hypothetical protein